MSSLLLTGVDDQGHGAHAAFTAALLSIQGSATLEIPGYVAIRGGPVHILPVTATANGPELRAAIVSALRTAGCRKVTSEKGDPIRSSISVDWLPIAAPVIYLVRYRVPNLRWPEFDEWYETEHLPILLSAKGWLRCRRYLLAKRDPGHRHTLAIHELASVSPLRSPYRRHAKETEWRQRLALHDWFVPSLSLYRRLLESSNPNR